MFKANAIDLATPAPTNNAPIKPGDCVKAIADKSFKVISAIVDVSPV